MKAVAEGSVSPGKSLQCLSKAGIPSSLMIHGIPKASCTLPSRNSSNLKLWLSQGNSWLEAVFCPKQAQGIAAPRFGDAQSSEFPIPVWSQIIAAPAGLGGFHSRREIHLLSFRILLPGCVDVAQVCAWGAVLAVLPLWDTLHSSAAGSWLFPLSLGIRNNSR